MKTRKISIMMASAAIFGSMMAGCSSAGDRPKVAVNDGQSLAPKVERALADKDIDGALAMAERLVTAEPQDGAARALLGRAYLANGRYVSARAAFNDALTLGNRDPRTIVSLALCETSLGNVDGARQLLTERIADLPAGDYGLAMAMAGDPREGVRALIEASHLPDATAKTRQNLAYALAMGGAWGQARLIAGQDLTAREAEARMAQWAQSFSHGTESDRVVAMIGVSPRTDDAGLPVQLALNLAPKAQEQTQIASVSDLVQDAARTADAAPAPVAAKPVQAAVVAVAAPAPVKTATVAKAASAPMPIQGFAPSALAAALAKAPTPPTVGRAPSSAIQAAAKAVLAPAPKAAVQKSAPVPAAVKAAFVPAAAVPAPAPAPVPAAKPISKPVVRAPSPAAVQAVFRQPASAGGTGWATAFAAPATGTRASDWVIQLGAFNSDSVARAKWQGLASRHGELKSFNAVHSTVARNGQTFYRLAIRGFETRGAASNACSTLRTVGQDCFVRLDDNKAKKAVAYAEQPSGRSRPSR